MNATNVVTLILLFVGSSAFAVLVQGFVNRRKISRDTEAVAVTTATGLIKDMRIEMEARGREHQADIALLRGEVTHLRARLDVAEAKATAADARADKAEQHGVILGERLSTTQRKLAVAEVRIVQLEAVIKDLGHPVPPTPDLEG